MIKFSRNPIIEPNFGRCPIRWPMAAVRFRGGYARDVRSCRLLANRTLSRHAAVFLFVPFTSVSLSYLRRFSIRDVDVVSIARGRANWKLRRSTWYLTPNSTYPDAHTATRSYTDGVLVSRTIFRSCCVRKKKKKLLDATSRQMRIVISDNLCLLTVSILLVTLPRCGHAFIFFSLHTHTHTLYYILIYRTVRHFFIRFVSHTEKDTVCFFQHWFPFLNNNKYSRVKGKNS